MPKLPDGPFFGASGVFMLNKFMKRNDITPDVKAQCWKVIDIIYDNLLDSNGNKRTPEVIFEMVQKPLDNPTLALLTGVLFAREVYRWCSFFHDDDLGLLD
ncbi:hypothetical protein N0V85_009282, partial [Neurospora sp. IMI 360204]